MHSSIPITVKIKLFGALRNYSLISTINLEIPNGRNLLELKLILIEYFSNTYPSFRDEELIKSSVFANDQRILKDEEIIMSNIELSILPPVCGG